jgi:hypothetical protein
MERAARSKERLFFAYLRALSPSVQREETLVVDNPRIYRDTPGNVNEVLAGYLVAMILQRVRMRQPA